jgi:hypothetical protein
METKRPSIAAFDFDLTITDRDTFLPFLKLAFGSFLLNKVFLSMTFDGLCFVLGFTNRDQFKKKLIQKLFTGCSTESMTELGKLHATHIMQWLRPSALARIQWHKERGDRLVMVSASLDLYLKPVADKLGFDDLLCTQLNSYNHIYDGKLTGENCRGPEKVSQLKELLGSLSEYELYCYGDSAGDKELLLAADYPYYRAFEKGGVLYTEKITFS